MDKILKATEYLCKNCMTWKPLSDMATNTICKQCKQPPTPRQTSRNAPRKGFNPKTR